MTEPPAGSERRLVWRGALTTSRRLAASTGALVAPAALWLTGFLVVPLAVIAALAFASRGLDSEIVWRPTLSNLGRLAGFGSFGWTADYLRIVARTLWVAGTTTLVSVALAYPMAFFIARAPRRVAIVSLALVVVPMSTNVVIRAYAWQLALSPDLPLARAAAALGLVPPGRGLFPSGFAVLLGMVSTSLPFALLPIWVNVSRLDWTVVEAARDLHAGRWRTFRQVVLPLTWPGLGAALILTFVPAMGMFVMPDRLGGSRFMLIGCLVQQQFGPARDYPFGAAVATILILVTLAGLVLYRRLGRAVELA